MQRPNHLRSKTYFIQGKQEVPFLFKAENEKMGKSFEQLGIEESTTKHTKTKLIEIGCEISCTDFYGYSSLMLFIDLDVLDYNRAITDPMEGIYRAISKNSSLRHVTKFLMFYSGDPDYLSEKSRMIDKTLIFTSPIKSKVSQRDIILNWIENTPLGSEYVDCFQESLLVNVPNIDNLTVMRVCSKKKTITYGGRMILAFVFPNVYDAVQEIADIFRESPKYFLLSFASTCAGGNFIFNINPALVLYINHITPPDGSKLDKRNESLYDLVALQNTFVKKRMLTYMITDGSLKDIERLKLKLRILNFSGLKDFFVIISAHGFEGNLIVTKDGSYNVRDDIWLPMLENPTLKETQKYLIVNACRVELDEFHHRLLQTLKRLFNQNVQRDVQDDKSMMIYSTQKGEESYRFDGLGCIFLQEWNKELAKDFDEKAMEAMVGGAQKEMDKEFGMQTADLTTIGSQLHMIKMQPENYLCFKPLLENLLDGKLRKNKENDIIFMDAMVTRSSKEELELANLH